jgi:hypothetical protein
MRHGSAFLLLAAHRDHRVEANRGQQKTVFHVRSFAA